MLNFSLAFNGINDVTEFVRVCEVQPFKVTAYAKTYCVNAKSLIGMIYLSTEGKITVACNGCSLNEFSAFSALTEKWQCKESV